MSIVVKDEEKAKTLTTIDGVLLKTRTVLYKCSRNIHVTRDFIKVSLTFPDADLEV